MKLEQLEKSALELPDGDRAALAARLLSSLPAALVDEDDGFGEARRRSRDLDLDPNAGFSWQEIKDDLPR